MEGFIVTGWFLPRFLVAFYTIIKCCSCFISTLNWTFILTFSLHAVHKLLFFFSSQGSRWLNQTSSVSALSEYTICWNLKLFWGSRPTDFLKCKNCKYFPCGSALSRFTTLWFEVYNFSILQFYFSLSIRIFIYSPSIYIYIYKISQTFLWFIEYLFQYYVMY